MCDLLAGVLVASMVMGLAAGAPRHVSELQEISRQVVRELTGHSPPVRGLTIDAVDVDSDYALVHWTYEPERKDGSTILHRTGRAWRLVNNLGYGFQADLFEALGVPHPIAVRLRKHLERILASSQRASIVDGYAWCVGRPRAPDYPEEAKKRKQQGTVVLLSTYDTSGMISVRVIKSSHYQALDRAAARAVYLSGPCKHSIAGHPVPFAEFMATYTFQLDS